MGWRLMGYGEFTNRHGTDEGWAERLRTRVYWKWWMMVGGDIHWNKKGDDGWLMGWNWSIVVSDSFFTVNLRVSAKKHTFKIYGEGGEEVIVSANFQHWHRLLAPYASCDLWYWCHYSDRHIWRYHLALVELWYGIATTATVNAIVLFGRLQL